MGVDTRASASWERLASIVPQRLGGRSDTNITGRMELSKWGGGGEGRHGEFWQS